MNRLARNALIAALALAVVAGAAWVGRKVHRNSTERRLVTQAGQYLGQRDSSNAALCLRQALGLNPIDPEATKLMADLLEASGSPAALDWRIRAFQLKTNDTAYRLAWAETALRLQDPRSAAQALSGVEEKARSSAAYHKLVGALAWDRKDAVTAEQEYLEVLRQEPTNQAVALNLATIRLTSTNAAVADAARATLESISVNSPLNLTAQRYLMADAAMRQSFDKALKYSQAVVRDPAATHADKIQRLELLQRAKATELGAWQAQLEDEARGSPEHAFALGRWLVVAEGPTNALRWLQSLPETTQTNLPAPLVIADCEIALRDWKALHALVEKQYWGGAEVLPVRAGITRGPSTWGKRAGRRCLAGSFSTGGAGFGAPDAAKPDHPVVGLEGGTDRGAARGGGAIPEGTMGGQRADGRAVRGRQFRRA